MTTATTERSYKVNRSVVPAGRLKIWRSICVLKTFELQTLVDTTDLPIASIRKYVRPLMYCGILRLLETAKGGNGENRYQLTLSCPGSLPPIPSDDGRQVFDPNTQQVYLCDRPETPVDRAWATIRTGEAFVMADLVARDLHQKSHLYKWLAGLLEAGYVRQIRAAKPGPGGWPAQYELQNDPGALAPVVDRNGKVLNPNQEEG